MPERDYSHRDVVDKLGIKPGHLIVFDERAWPIDPDLRDRALERSGRPPAGEDEPADIVLATADDTTDAVALLARCRTCIQPAGGVWLLTPKRGQAGYVDQRLLIEAGPAGGLVDNKVCAISETVSAMRFVIRRADRPAKG